MTEESGDLQRRLAGALHDVAIAPPPAYDVGELRRAIARRAAPELARRRAHALRRRLFLPAGLAASIALLLSSVPLPPVAGGGSVGVGTTGDRGGAAVERLLDADVSDRQFRALLFGATDADELLLIAAGDNGQARDEAR